MNEAQTLFYEDLSNNITAAPSSDARLEALGICWGVSMDIMTDEQLDQFEKHPLIQELNKKAKRWMEDQEGE